MNLRTIMHVDLDAFFCSVEMLDQPALRGKPVLVGHPGRRSVVCAASYEARIFGCRSAQPMSQALARCPQAVVVTPRFERYRELSTQVMAIFREYTPLVEPISVDEAFLDLSGTHKLWGDPAPLGAKIRARIAGECGLPASIGIASSKLVAKLATEAAKPNGLREIAVGAEAEFLGALKVGALWGIGGKTEAILQRMGISYLYQLQEADTQALVAKLGPGATGLVALARGSDDRPVRSSHELQRMSHETTYEHDTNDIEVLQASILWQCEALADRLWLAGMTARSLHLKLRD